MMGKTSYWQSEKNSSVGIWLMGGYMQHKGDHLISYLHTPHKACGILYFLPTIQVLEIELRAPGLVASAFTQWTTSLRLVIYYKISRNIINRLLSYSPTNIAGRYLNITLNSIHMTNNYVLIENKKLLSEE